jgi:hypothetical protein
MVSYKVLKIRHTLMDCYLVDIQGISSQSVFFETPVRISNYYIFKKPGFINFHLVYSFGNMKKKNSDAFIASKRPKSRL